ncbi:uncharacterized protein LOC141947471 [Strix uralensis]|uniref:uncharacterized protein LOC141947471 n=1 Tax=Strix uralensis TaxID=36305 RepID=UPI003DA5A9CA
MGRPRKDPTSTSSPQPATAASKTTPAALPPSPSATQAKAVAVGSRSRSALAAGAAGPSRGAKPDSSQPRPTASRGAKSESTQPRPTASRGAKSDSTQPRPTTSRGAKSGSTQPRPTTSRGAKSGSTQPRPTTSRGGQGDARDQHTGSAGSRSATQKKPPDAKGAAGSARPDPHLQKPGAESSEAWSQFLPPLESQDIPWVEKETRGQRSNPNWYKWRENRITASVAPKIANSKFANNKTTEVPQSYLKAVVSSSPGVQTPAMAWGIRKEKVAVKAYEQMKSQALGKPVWVDDCGLFIHRDKNWIAASPDGIIKEAATGRALGLLEVKCPYKHRNRTVREACKDKDFCLELDGDSYALKKDHAYFTQVQCQLAAADFQRADFVVHTTKETAVVPVEFDAEFWGQTVPKLEKFYTEAVIPHLEEKANGSVWAKEE